MSEVASSVIHDIGYQRYEGPRLGRGYVLGSLYTHGLRTAFGLGRSAKAKIFPWIVVGIVGLVAVVLAAVRAQFNQVPLTYVQFDNALILLVILFLAIVAPELVSRDLRSGVLPLYLSRPLHNRDYALAKLASLVSATVLMLGGAQLVMFIAGVFTVKGWSAKGDELVDFLQGLAYTGCLALLFASLALLVASTTGRRAFAAGGIVALFLMTTPVVGVLSVLPSTTTNYLAGLASPMTLIQGFGVWAFDMEGIDLGGYGPVYAAVTAGLTVLSVLLLLARYRKVSQ